MSRLSLVLIGILLIASNLRAEHIRPYLTTVDLDIGESVDVNLSDGFAAAVKLVNLDEKLDAVTQAVREATVTIEINGERATLVSGTYQLPKIIGKYQIDCPVTKGYNDKGRASSWGLDKDARLRLWPADAPWISENTFMYPAKQKWFATDTQMANEPVHVDGGERPDKASIYYHSGLDIGGSEGEVEIVAATNGLVVSSKTFTLNEHKNDTPVSPRYDVVYILDERGWYYRYSHLKTIDDAIKPGVRVKMGDRLGVLGKEGGSGGWTHLHFEIKSRQPSGKWGTQEGYAFLWQAYLREHAPKAIAVARPHHLIWAGDSVTLDATKSWAASGEIAKFEWQFGDGSAAAGAKVERTYDTPGRHSEVVKITTSDGSVAYDFAVVIVYDRENPNRHINTIHANYAPTFGIRAGDPVTFKVRSFIPSEPREVKETWDFGDGSPPAEVQSDGNAEKLAPDGYAETTHVFEKVGDYIVRVDRVSEHGVKSTGHVWVHVEPETEVKVTSDIEFARPDNVPLLLNLHMPDGVENPPLLMFIHGGGWQSGDRTRCKLAWVAKHGIAVASVEYRLSKESLFPAQIHDCKGALRWLRANADEYGYDASRVVVAGTSAGGHLAGLMGTSGDVAELEGKTGGNADQSSRVQGAIDFYGPSDFVSRAKTHPEKCEEPGGGVYRLLGGKVTENLDAARLASPVTHISDDDPPLLILHGVNDKIVKLDQSEIFRDAYAAAGLDVKLHIKPKVGHGWKDTEDDRKLILETLRRWFAATD